MPSHKMTSFCLLLNSYLQSITKDWLIHPHRIFFSDDKRRFSTGCGARIFSLARVVFKSSNNESQRT